MLEQAVALNEDDIPSYEQQFRVAVRGANDYANRRTGFSADTDPLDKNRLRAEFLNNGKINKIEADGKNNDLPGYTAAATALRELAARLVISKEKDAPSTVAPPVAVIKKSPSPS